MDKEIFDILKEYDVQFTSLKNSNFCRLPGSPTLKILDECYRKIFGRASKLLNGCGSCIMQSLRELSVEYFKELDRVQSETEPKPVTNSQPIKSTRGRKPKATNNE